MSPLRSRRRRAFAVPFVLTAAFAPGCAVKDPGPGATGPGPVVHSDPPATLPADGGAPDHPPVVIANPPAPRPAAVPEGWTWQRQDDGTCYAYPPMPECRPNVVCNPPPPRKIDCPADGSGGETSKP